MEVIKFNSDKKINNVTLLLGSFETLHIGHKTLIDEAKKYDDKVAIFTFSNFKDLPKQSNSFKSFTSLELHLVTLANAGIDYVIVADFDDSFSKIEPDKFIEIIKEKINPKRIVIGKDYKFGSKGKGNFQYLKDNFENTIVKEIFKINNKKIGTNIVKEAIEFGDIDFLEKILIQKWRIPSFTVDNNILKFDDNQLLPPPGIFIAEIIYNGFAYPAAVHLDFDDIKKSIFKIIDTDIDLSGKYFALRILAKYRSIIKDSQNGLIESDIKNIKKHFIY
ncbi:MAG: hypothetical protein NC236_02550 [Mycoplasma sp.]|nr:hypothetical protein [Mycoplasma sp.]